MKTLWTKILTVGALAGLLTIGAQAAGPAQRQVNQAGRIRQGVQSGQLTQRETARLKHQEKQLHRQVVRSRASGGGLTPGERARIQGNARQNSRLIGRLKHNNRTR